MIICSVLHAPSSCLHHPTKGYFSKTWYSHLKAFCRKISFLFKADGLTALRPEVSYSEGIKKSSSLYSTASPMKSQSSQNCILLIFKKLLLSCPPPSPIKISKSLANKTAYMKEVKLHQPLTGTSKKPNPFKPLWKRTALICVCLII